MVAGALTGLRVAVVGAGPAGVCATAALAHAGARVTWIDGTGHVSTDGKGHGVTATGNRNPNRGSKTDARVQTGFGSVGRFGHFGGVHW
jgi:flavin-dependent dehydrogenase